MATCPHCSTEIDSLSVEGVPAVGLDGREFRSVVFGCLNCNKAIGASFDGLTTHALIEKMEKELKQEIQKQTRLQR